jgi:hypothetical protein
VRIRPPLSPRPKPTNAASSPGCEERGTVCSRCVGSRPLLTATHTASGSAIGNLASLYPFADDQLQRLPSGDLVGHLRDDGPHDAINVRIFAVDQPVQHHPTEGEPRCSEYPEPKLARGVQERNNLSPQGIPLRESPCLACQHDEVPLASARSTYGHNRWMRTNRRHGAPSPPPGSRYPPSTTYGHERRSRLLSGGAPDYPAIMHVAMPGIMAAIDRRRRPDARRR